MFFDCFSIFSKFQYLSICNNLLFSFICWYNFFNTVTISFTNQGDIFVIDHAISNFHFSFINTEIIWCNCTLYNILTKAPRTFDKDVIIVACYKVNSEHYASGFREYHHLNGSTQCNCHMIETLFYTVVCCTVCESRCITFFYFLDDNVGTTYI